MFLQKENQSIINFGTLLGLAVGLSIGMFGALSWNHSLVNRTGPVAVRAPFLTSTPEGNALDSLRVLLIERVALVTDILRAAANGTDHGQADTALTTNTAETQQALNTIIGSGRAQDYTKLRGDELGALVEFATALKAKDDKAADKLKDASTTTQGLASALSNGSTSSSRILSLLTQEQGYLRAYAAATFGQSSRVYNLEHQLVTTNSALVTAMTPSIITR